MSNTHQREAMMALARNDLIERALQRAGIAGNFEPLPVFAAEDPDAIIMANTAAHHRSDPDYSHLYGITLRLLAAAGRGRAVVFYRHTGTGAVWAAYENPSTIAPDGFSVLRMRDLP